MLNLNQVSFLISKKPAMLEIIIEVLRIYNCRVSEILSAKWNDFFEDHFLILRGKKHSKDIVIRETAILNSISKLKKLHPELIFANVTYSQVYNYLKKNYSHLLSDEFTRKNSKVTHYFRYSSAKLINNIKDAKLILHHNSKKSCGYYNHKLKEE